MTVPRRSLGLLGAAGAAFGLATLVTGAALGASPRLLVFLHVAVKQRAFQNLLQSALPGVGVTAVGRVADFDRALADGQDAVLSLPAVLQAKGLAVQLRGFRQGASDEKYALVGADATPDPARVRAVGALDLLGREGTTAFVHGLLTSGPKVERVTKVEDLLPLLQMQRVEAIVLPQRMVGELRGMSRLNLAARELSNKVGLPAVATVGPAGAVAVAAVAKLPAEAARSLGVEEWR